MYDREPMRRARIGLWFATLMWAGVSSTARGAHAQAAPSDGATAAEGGSPTARAQKHFARARELYAAGSYRDAITELEAAHELDPSAKDLVYNLALVNEKLGQIDEALRWMHRYAEMDLDVQERARSESTIRRLEGAKKTLAEAKANEEQQPPPPPPPAAESPKPGRIDALTITAGAVSVVGLGVGTIFGISALSSRPKAGFVTGQNGTYTDLSDQAKSAHSKALVADIGFGVGIAGAVACGLLYFLRPREQHAAAPAAAHVSIATFPHGAGLTLQGAL